MNQKVSISKRKYVELTKKARKFEQEKRSAERNRHTLVKLDDGLWINGAKVNNLIDCEISSSADSFTEVTIKFIAEVDGLDNINIERYSFRDKE